MKSHLVNYFSNFWNFLDWFSYITLVVAICLREFLQSEGQIYARNMFALSLLFMHLRFLETFLTTKKTGTIVIMIIEMVPIFFFYNSSIRTDIIRYFSTSICNHLNCLFVALLFVFLLSFFISAKRPLEIYRNNYVCGVRIRSVLPCQPLAGPPITMEW